MKIFLSAFSLIGLTALGFASDPNVALNKPVIDVSSYYNQGTEVFPAQTITDGRYNDSGSPSDWSFWLTPDGTNGNATIDLGSNFNISSFVLQDTHNRGYFDRGTADYSISVSSDNVSFTNVVSDSFSAADRNNLTLKTDTVSNVTGRYVRIDLLSRYGSSAGLNEVEVHGQPVPEPTTFAALGLGALGLLKRRRRG